MVLEFRVVKFWYEIIFVIRNMTLALRARSILKSPLLIITVPNIIIIITTWHLKIIFVCAIGC